METIEANELNERMYKEATAQSVLLIEYFQENPEYKERIFEDAMKLGLSFMEGALRANGVQCSNQILKIVVKETILQQIHDDIRLCMECEEPLEFRHWPIISGSPR